MSTANENETVAVWVFFKDKGPMSPAGEDAGFGEIAQTYPRRTLERRLRARPGRPFDRADLALHRPYIEALERMGIECIDFYHCWYILSLDAWELRKSGGAVDALLKASRLSP